LACRETKVSGLRELATVFAGAGDTKVGQVEWFVAHDRVREMRGSKAPYAEVMQLERCSRFLGG
jgi:hypothetical protein